VNVAGGLLGVSDGLLVGRLLGALEVGAPARTIVGTLEGYFLGDGEGAEEEEDTSGATEGPGLGGETGVAVTATGLSMGATGGTKCRCNRRSLLLGSETPSCSFPSASLRAVLTDDRRFFCCDLSAWQSSTTQATKITNALDLDHMMILIVSLRTILTRSVMRR
jgi:hypothetical protein